jgi:tetratricopeptide (TPR) repeat protein
MKIHELQDTELMGHDDLWLKHLDDKHKEWNEKRIDESHYHSQLAFLYAQLFKPEECKHHAALVPAWAQAQEKANSLSSVARILVYEKKIAEALDYYEQAFAVEPRHEVVIEEAGWCCFDLKQFEKAQEWFTIGTLLEDDDSEVFWEGLGLSLAHQQKHEEAITAFKKALELCDVKYNGHMYQHFIGQCYAGLNDFYRALGFYTQALDAKPTYAPALNDIAALYYNEEGDMNTAIEYLKNAEAAAEESGDSHILQAVYINLTRLYGQAKEFKLHEYYNQKVLESLGLGGLLDFGDDDDEEGSEF